MTESLSPTFPSASELALPEYSVSSLSQALKTTIETNYNYVRVRGEISQPKLYTSGHLYLRLKDDKAVLEAICWKGSCARLSLKPEEGMEVICTGRITTYPGRSQYQIIIETMELAGQGALLKLIEDRKRKLASEGLFDETRKKPLPFLPQTIGLITSPTGAVIHDILHRLKARFPCHVILWPVAVQGEMAASQIVNAIDGFNALPLSIKRPDVIIVARGGGSLEDLMPFNQEEVVRAVARSRIPLISAVGHEPDFTLIDYAADVRAPTPTAAAEIVVPVKLSLESQILDLGRQLRLAPLRKISEHQLHLRAMSRGLLDPKNLILSHWQTLDDRSQRLTLFLRRGMERHHAKLAQLGMSLLHPRELMKDFRVRMALLTQRTENYMRRLLDMKEQNSIRLGQLLESYSFKNVLARGYAYVCDQQHHAVTQKSQLQKGQIVTLHFQDGSAPAVIGNSDHKKPSQGNLF